MSQIHLLDQLRGKIIVSCQARSGEPFDAPFFIAEFAKSAVLGGAAGVRVDRAENVLAVKQATQIPIVGIRKRIIEDQPVFITPTFQDVQEIVEAGADIIGMDATKRERPLETRLRDLIDFCHTKGRLVLADVATFEDAQFAEEAGADFIATTLSGYTAETKGRALPDIDLLEQIVKHLSVPAVLEGGVVNPEDVRRAFAAGAHTVIIGKSITMPHFITRRFAQAAPSTRNQ